MIDDIYHVDLSGISGSSPLKESSNIRKFRKNLLRIPLVSVGKIWSNLVKFGQKSPPYQRLIKPPPCLKRDRPVRPCCRKEGIRNICHFPTWEVRKRVKKRRFLGFFRVFSGLGGVFSGFRAPRGPPGGPPGAPGGPFRAPGGPFRGFWAFWAKEISTEIRALHASLR